MSKTFFLTAAIDVQRGSKNNLNNPSHLEIEVMGHEVLMSEAKEIKNKAIESYDDFVLAFIAEIERAWGECGIPLRFSPFRDRSLSAETDEVG